MFQRFVQRFCRFLPSLACHTHTLTHTHLHVQREPPQNKIKRIGSKDKRNYLQEPMRKIRNTLNCKSMGKLGGMSKKPETE